MTQYATQHAPIPRTRIGRLSRSLVLLSLGPATAVAGLVWAFVQPWRITLLHPRGQGFWWLLVEPPLLVIAAAVVFHLLVARPLVRELEESR
ncbi:MAG TPA: hypothetical protein VFA66_01710 [Gaiellaceae bacterium]|nr:hypothetical protein [Gaiellaceae bacterium]